MDQNKILPRDMLAAQLPMIWASTSNTMPATFWTMYYLLLDSDVRHAVVATIDGLFTSSSPDYTTIPQDALNQLHVCIQ